MLSYIYTPLVKYTGRRAIGPTLEILIDKSHACTYKVQTLRCQILQNSKVFQNEAAQSTKWDTRLCRNCMCLLCKVHMSGRHQRKCGAVHQRPSRNIEREKQDHGMRYPAAREFDEGTGYMPSWPNGDESAGGPSQRTSIQRGECRMPH